MCGLFVARWFMVPRSSCGETFVVRILTTDYMHVKLLCVLYAFLEISKPLQNKIDGRVLFQLTL